jgi:ascorbate-specific PTS system EIIC-type component UlaA
MKSKTMKIITWIVQGLLSVGILMPAMFKFMTPYEEFASQQSWAEDFTPTQVLIIGALELLGVIGLNLPLLLKKYTKLVPVASTGIVLLFAGAVMTHIGRGEGFIPPLVMMIMALFVTYSRKDLFKS